MNGGTKVRNHLHEPDLPLRVRGCCKVGLAGSELESQLRKLPALRFRKQGDMVEFGWKFDGLTEWAESAVTSNGQPMVRGSG